MPLIIKKATWILQNSYHCQWIDREDVQEIYDELYETSIEKWNDLTAKELAKIIFDIVKDI